jgi:N-acetylglucosamine malate deacetylase 2
MKRHALLLLAALMLLLINCSKPVTVQKKILIVYAHPDDETTSIGPVVAKLAKQHEVILVTLTNGGMGYREHAGIPKGDSLAAVRKKELECACKKLGIDSLVMLGLHDGLGLLDPGGIKDYFQLMRDLRAQLPALISTIDPDMIITFGPDGDSGHTDHRQASDFVTEALLANGWVDKYPLYYSAWTKTQAEMYGGLGFVADEYLNVEVHYSDEEEQQYFDALRCHWSQYSEAEVKTMTEEDTRDKTNTIYFRRFAVAKGRATDFP